MATLQEQKNMSIQDLIQSCIPLACDIAWSYKRRSYMDFDQIKAQALYSLTKSASHWDKDKNIKFNTFCTRLIKWDMDKYLRANKNIISPSINYNVLKPDAQIEYMHVNSQMNYDSLLVQDEKPNYKKQIIQKIMSKNDYFKKLYKLRFVQNKKLDQLGQIYGKTGQCMRLKIKKMVSQIRRTEQQLLKEIR